ncbi:HD domain-containing phosphohydrolase [Spirochaeta cellobiosiphila]|uniref:HD domain-containing phosphohydrolase n=1 Tax=Spirochaeta cellobiosiphila TaxID=504483 RepID=UPI0003FB24CB|nr:HD domain-containing phosphohydrolase [Spirochaeta cellobiosiphila]
MHEILLVDDEANILNSLKRVFIDYRDLLIFTASSAREAMAIIASKDRHIDLVISDERMPEVAGSRFLEAVKIKFPHIVRIMLTGYADKDAVMRAVNSGEVYRFLEKPWDNETIIMTVRNGLEYGRLVNENRSLNAKVITQNKQLQSMNHKLEMLVEDRTDKLKKALVSLQARQIETTSNLKQIVLLLTSITELFQANLGTHHRRVASLCSKMAHKMDLKEEEVQDLVLAAMLHDIGAIGHESQQDKENPKSDPEIGANLLEQVFELEKIAHTIRYHKECWDGSGIPNHLSGSSIPLFSRIIKLASDWDDLWVNQEQDGRKCLQIMDQKKRFYDPALYKVFYAMMEEEVKGQVKQLVEKIELPQLKAGMTIMSNIRLKSGVLFLPSETFMTEDLIEKVMKLADQIKGTTITVKKV